MQDKFWRNNNRGAKDFFKKIIPHTLFVTFVCERELETEQRLQHIDLTSPSRHSRVLFSFSWCSTGGSRAQLSVGFFYHISSLTHLVPDSIGDPEGPLCCLVVFSTTSCLQLIWSPTPSGVPRAPLCWVVVFSTTSCIQLIWSPNRLTSCSHRVI